MSSTPITQLTRVELQYREEFVRELAHILRRIQQGTAAKGAVPEMETTIPLNGEKKNVQP